MKKARQGGERRENPVDRLAIMMQRLGISRNDLSRRLGITTSAIAMYFSRRRLRKTVALAIESAYGVRAEWIMQGKKPMYLDRAPVHLSTDAVHMAVLFDTLPAAERHVAKSVVESLARRQPRSA